MSSLSLRDWQLGPEPGSSDSKFRTPALQQGRVRASDQTGRRSWLAQADGVRVVTMNQTEGEICDLKKAGQQEAAVAQEGKKVPGASQG